MSESAISTAESGNPTASATASDPNSGAQAEPVAEYNYQNAYKYFPTSGLGVRFGVINHTNLFEPNQDITYYITFTKNTVEGETATVRFTCDALGVSKENTHTIAFDGKEEMELRGAFSAEKNGVYTLSLAVSNTEIELSFKIGVVPKSQTAKTSFYFGMQPYVSQAFHNSRSVLSQNSKESVESILSTIEWLGCNLIREDGISWSTSQESADDAYDFTEMDQVVDAAAKHGQNFLWILGNSPLWAVMEKYQDAEDVKTKSWAYPPELDYWNARITAVAEHYKDNKTLLYEIWNEADWEFFLGTEEEYQALLDSACRIIKKINPDAYVIPSALVSSWETSLNPEKFAKDSMKYYTKYYELMNLNLIDALNVHDHTLFTLKNFFASVDRRDERLKRAGFSGNIPGILVSEAGIWSKNDEDQAVGLTDKILWYRANQYGGYVAYTFRPESSGKQELTWEIFDESLQPRWSAIAYGTLVGFLGQCDYVEKIPGLTSAAYADVYYDGSKSVVPLFSRADEAETLQINTTAPFKAYDIYGNELEVKKQYPANKSVIYLVFDGKVKASDFRFV